MSVCKCDECDKEDCRNYIDYDEDEDCVLVSIHKHDNLTLEQVGDRLDLSAERIRQIQNKAIEKIKRISKKSRKYEIDEYT